MQLFAIYNLTTGVITQCGRTADPDLLELAAGEAVLLDVGAKLGQLVQGGVVVDAPALAFTQSLVGLVLTLTVSTPVLVFVDGRPLGQLSGTDTITFSSAGTYAIRLHMLDRSCQDASFEVTVV